MTQIATFPAGTKVKYRQDFRSWEDLWMEDKTFTVVGEIQHYYRLSAEGYGGKEYGNGQILVKKDFCIPYLQEVDE